MQNAISTLFDQVHVISLPRSEDRRAHIRRHFAEVGLIDYTFFEATDQDATEVEQAYIGKQVMTYPPCFRCGKDSCGREDCNNILIPPQVAVCLTYLRLWEKIAKDPQRALVVEDDVLFQPDAEKTLDCLASTVTAGDIVWTADIPRLLRLGWALGPDHVTDAPFRINDDVRMSNPCHALTSVFAQALLDRHNGISTTADIYIHQVAPRSGEALTVLPPLASELSWSRGSVASLIHPKSLRTEYLRQQGDEAAARENERLLRDHRAHASADAPAYLPGQSSPRPTVMTSSERWLDEAAFSRAWDARNKAMLALCEERLGRVATIRFAEYGCGPRSPFTAVAQAAGYVPTLRYDFKQWPHANHRIDLNRPPFIVEHVPVGVLSGVVEYLDNPRATLACLCEAHTYILFSYAIAPHKTALADAAHIEMLHARCATHGWRNHYDLTELTRLIGEFGYLEAIQMYGNQVIALLRVFACRGMSRGAAQD